MAAVQLSSVIALAIVLIIIVAEPLTTAKGKPLNRTFIIPAGIMGLTACAGLIPSTSFLPIQLMLTVIAMLGFFAGRVDYPLSAGATAAFAAGLTALISTQVLRGFYPFMAVPFLLLGVQFADLIFTKYLPKELWINVAILVFGLVALYSTSVIALAGYLGLVWLGYPNQVSQVNQPQLRRAIILLNVFSMVSLLVWLVVAWR